MRKLMKKFETVMMAAAFAEEGEFETARKLMKEEKPRTYDRPAKQKKVSQRKELRAD